MRLPFIGERRWPSFWNLFERTFPVQMGLLAILFTAAFITNGNAVGAAPMLGALVVFYWRLHLPGLLPLWSLLMLGLCQDILTGDILGVGFVTFLPILVFTGARASRAFSTNFWFAWFLSIVTLAMCGFLHYVLYMVMTLTLLDPMPLIYRYGTSMGLYPVVTVLFTWFEVRLSGAATADEKRKRAPRKKLRVALRKLR